MVGDKHHFIKKDKRIMSNYNAIKVTSKGPRLTITINRPDAMNALNEEVLEDGET